MERVEYLTKSYITAYNTAMKEVRNPEFAAQIAMCVLLALGQEYQQVIRQNPFLAMFSATGQEIIKGKKKPRDDKKDGDSNE